MRRRLFVPLTQVLLSRRVAQILRTVVVSNMVLVGYVVARRSRSEKRFGDQRMDVFPRAAAETDGFVASVVTRLLEHRGHVLGPVGATTKPLVTAEPAMV